MKTCMICTLDSRLSPITWMSRTFYCRTAMYLHHHFTVYISPSKVIFSVTGLSLFLLCSTIRFSLKTVCLGVYKQSPALVKSHGALNVLPWQLARRAPPHSSHLTRGSYRILLHLRTRYDANKTIVMAHMDAMTETVL